MKATHAVWHNQAVLGETEFRLNGELGELQRLSAEVARFCHAEPDAANLEFNLNLILEELFVNAMEHGGCKGLQDVVAVHLTSSDAALQVTFADRGAPFDSTCQPEPQLHTSLAHRATGGLGLHFVRQLARDLQYRRTDSWNLLTFRLPFLGEAA